MLSRALGGVPGNQVFPGTQLTIPAAQNKQSQGPTGHLLCITNNCNRGRILDVPITKNSKQDAEKKLLEMMNPGRQTVVCHFQ